MSRVEFFFEDRKFLLVKSWFLWSVSFGGIYGLSVVLVVGVVLKGLFEGNGYNGED